MQDNRKYIYGSEKNHPFTCCPAANHQNAANLALQTFEENQWTFLWHRTGVDFSSRNNFA